MVQRGMPKDTGRIGAAGTGGKRTDPAEASPRTASTDPAADRAGTSEATTGTSEEPTGVMRAPVGDTSAPDKSGEVRPVGGANPEDGEPRIREAETRAPGKSMKTEVATFDRKAAQEKLLVER